MSARLLMPCLLTAALLAVPDTATAKPPDLPVTVKVTCAPQIPPTQPEPKRGPITPIVIFSVAIPVPEPQAVFQPSEVPQLVLSLGVNADGVITSDVIIEEQTLVAPVRTWTFPTSRKSLHHFLRCTLMGLHPALGLLPVEFDLGDDEDHSPPYKKVEGCFNTGMGCVLYTATRQIIVNETTTGSLLFGVGVNSDAGLIGTLVEQLKELPVEVTAEPYTCPFLKAKASQQAESGQKSVTVTTVLDNLEKLQRAAQAFEKAEALRQGGELYQAGVCYEQVRKLCPGSAIAALASAQLAQLGDAVTELILVPVGVEEQEGQDACPKCPAQKLQLMVVPIEGNGKDGACEECETPTGGLSGLLHEVFTAVTAGTCTEVDCSKPGLPRFRCELQFGDFRFQMQYDERGRGGITLDATISSKEK